MKKPARLRPMPRAAILTIGNELLTGRTVNSNAAVLGGELTRLGFEVCEQRVCPDEVEKIKCALKDSENAELLIVTGGLGPTPDDVTREAMAAYFSVPLKFSPAQFRAMARIYKKLGRKLPALSRREAYYPANSHPLLNRFGIALGFFIPEAKRMTVVLPGVPTEMRKMFENDVIPLIRRRFKNLSADKVLTVRMTGISEPRIMEKLGKNFFNRPFQFGIYPSEGETQICIRSPSAALIDSLRKKIKKRLQGWIYAWEDAPLAEVIAKELIRRKKTLSVAESCTGGNLSAALTAVPGASRYFLGAMTAYHSSVKERLGVPVSVLKNCGVVSPEVAAELALRACDFFSSDYGIGVTGVAGPSGGTAKNPVGLVCIATAYAGEVLVERCRSWGNREQVQRKAVAKALEQLWRLIFKPR